MSDLYRLVYASKNLLQGSDAEIAQAVSQILDASQRNNAKVGVTGALMFNAGAFAQVLEGPQQGVETTFERIQCDPRHGDVTVLQCGPAGERSFANWSMAFVGQSGAGQARWEGIAATSGFDLSRLDGDAVFAMLHGLVLDEEGVTPTPGILPHGAATPERPIPALDVARVRSELPQPGQALQAAAQFTTLAPEVSEPAAMLGSPATPLSKAAPPPGAALVILREALARERQCTTDLRGELDDARVTLAVQTELFEALRQERDLWANRARLMATALGQEASAVELGSHRAAAPVGAAPARDSGLIRAVA